MRKTFALILSAALLASLSACATAGSGLDEGSCTPLADPGSASETITASGDPGSAKLDFATPLVAKKTERSVLTEGTGPAAEVGDVIWGKAVLASGTDTTSAQQTPFMITLDKTVTPVGFTDALACARAGDRIAAVIPAAQATTDATQVPSGDSADAYVFDITSVYPGSAPGAPQPAEAGFPSVVTAPDGRPGVTIPSGDVPTDLRFTTLKKGSGATVAENDVLVMQSLGIVWKDKSVFESTWKDGMATQKLVTDISANKNGVVPGLAKALVGQTIGSQVLVVVPPADGFGDTGSTGVPAGSTVVYVVDILGANPAS
ncbi:FKBP-type peptidyl-prolyl cis-trans isomerase [Agreia sp. COWG]|uniref:FKBP-type peptidyl-prolyl cis-trans isomerase n=1 Tax=Agreia sp. COWG TaxID=2773266 RepID=UPI00192727DA|nr:FKBP-type peptidyl-prolyl cis-trans isomerase [Agreia sp. COWG]CAD5997814.1 Peptidyl-prolyl cis-trans isomerase [Agreia sp. COWG]